MLIQQKLSPPLLLFSESNLEEYTLDHTANRLPIQQELTAMELRFLPANY